MTNHEHEYTERVVTPWGMIVRCACGLAQGTDATVSEQQYLDARREKYG